MQLITIAALFYPLSRRLTGLNEVVVERLHAVRYNDGMLAEFTCFWIILVFVFAGVFTQPRKRGKRSRLKCPSCRRYNLPYAQYCSQCGTQLRL